MLHLFPAFHIVLTEDHSQEAHGGNAVCAVGQGGHGQVLRELFFIGFLLDDDLAQGEPVFAEDNRADPSQSTVRQDPIIQSALCIGGVYRHDVCPVIMTVSRIAGNARIE